MWTKHKKPVEDKATYKSTPTWLIQDLASWLVQRTNGTLHIVLPYSRLVGKSSISLCDDSGVMEVSSYFGLGLHMSEQQQQKSQLGIRLRRWMPRANAYTHAHT